MKQRSIYDKMTGSEKEVAKFLMESDIFDELYKADLARHDLNSNGLGLPICKRIVEKHGGKIWAESQGYEKGTTVIFTLPLSSKKDQK